jgi:uncharacterized membrane protein (DUF4010 family)
MRKKSKTLWFTDLLFIVITVASFTGLLIPEGRIGPKLWGAPYTVWMGVVFCFLYILLAYIASKFQQEEQDDH